MSNFLRNIHPLLRRTAKNTSDDNYAILNAIDELLQNVEKETVHSKVQSSLYTAEGEWLDQWAEWFGVYRKDNEADNNFRKRVIKYVDIPRGTNSSIKLAIRRYLEDPTIGVEIYEPWKNIFYLDSSKLDGTDKLMGNYYRFAVITVYIGVPFDDDLKYYLDRFKPAGVKMNLIYDPSLPRVGEDNDNIAIPMLNIFPYEPQPRMIRLSGLDNYLGGRIQLTDTDKEVNPFYTDVSKTNSSDVLTGFFSQTREHYHLASIGRGLIPSLNSTLGETLMNTKEAPEGFYEATKSIDDATQTIKISQADQLYFTLNIDNYIFNKYYGTETKLKRTRESYAKVLGEPEFTLAFSGDISGKIIEFQAFNFYTNKWVTLEKLLTSNEITKVNIQLGDSFNYLNENRLMFTRIVTNGNYELSIDYFALDYRTEH